jgi:hypothetical protein
MGYKLVFQLAHTGTLTANDFSVSVPFNTPFATANDIFQAAPGASFVARLNASSNTFTIWFPLQGNVDFPVTKGEGYLIRIPSGTSTSITLVGSNDPAFTYNFNIAGRDFLISIPYSTTWQVAQDVFGGDEAESGDEHLHHLDAAAEQLGKQLSDRDR